MKTVPLLTLQRWHDNARAIERAALNLQKEILSHDLDGKQLLVVALGDAVIGGQEAVRELSNTIQLKHDHENATAELALHKGDAPEYNFETLEARR